MNFFTGELIDVLPDRRKAYLARYFTSIKLNTSDYVLNISELDNVKYISMDLSYNFKDIASRYFPHALVCADSFHVIRHLTEAFKKIRLRCMRTTQNAALLYLLGKFKFVFRHGAHLDNEPRYNKSLGKYANLRDKRNFLFENFPNLAKAYNLKEYYIHFNSSNTISSAPTALTSVIEAFAASGIPEYDDFFTMLVNWRQEIINSFTVVQGKRINNSYIESKNNLIKRLQSNANGFRNFSRARKRILYCINKYDSFSL